MLGMKLEDVSESRDEVKVTTTGAIFVLSKSSQGEVYCYQRIGAERLATTLTLHASLRDMTIDWVDDESCILQRPIPDMGIGIRINADSTLFIRSEGVVTKVRFDGEWVPKYAALDRGNFLFMDEQGGVGAYPLKHGSQGTSRTKVRRSANGWSVHLSLKGQRLVTSVFPPRPFDWKKSLDDRIVHHFFSHPPTKPWTAYPRDDEIEEYSKRGNILVLHWWQKGLRTRIAKGVQTREELRQDSPWTTFNPLPLDDSDMKRTVNRAHELRMKVIAYLSSLYFPGEPDEFANEAGSVIETHQLDGIYIDGVPNDVLQAYRVMRAVRKLLGNKILYVHVPSPIMGRYDRDYVYCPFIETYADFILKAEHIFRFDYRHLRYTISGHNISNPIGFVCNYDYEPKFTRKLIALVPKANIRLPYWVGFDEYVQERQKAIGRKYYPLEESRGIMRREYFPLLEALSEKREHL